VSFLSDVDIIIMWSSLICCESSWITDEPITNKY